MEDVTETSTPVASVKPETNYHAPRIPDTEPYTALSIIPLGGACEIART